MFPLLAGLFGASTSTVGGALAAGIGTSLVSGLLQKDQKQITQNTVDYEQMRASAEAAGFNPLTALKNGGTAGFSTSTTTVPALSSSQAIKQAIGKGVETWFNRDQIMRDAERDRLELDLMRAELKGINEASAVVRDRDFGYSIPHAVQKAGVDYAAPSRPALAPVSGHGVGPDASVAGGGPSSRVAGADIAHSPSWDDTQKLEDRYGDLVSLPYGVAVGLADLGGFAASKLAPRFRVKDRGVVPPWRDRKAIPNRPVRRPAPVSPYQADGFGRYYPR